MAIFILAAPVASAATLADLFAGASIDAGTARFSNWQLVSADATAATIPNLALVNVSSLDGDIANPGLQFNLGEQLAISGLNAIDLAFSYRIQSINAVASFTSHSLDATGGVTSTGPGGVAIISQNLVAQNGADLGAAVAIADYQDAVFQLTASASHAPRLSATVNVNIFLQGMSATDAINLTTFTQHFAHNGPTTLAGDFNNDKSVDGADFLAWQRNATPGLLTAANLTVWRSNFGQSIAAVPAVTAVPEPAAPLALALGLGGLMTSRRRPRPRGLG